LLDRWEILSILLLNLEKQNNKSNLNLNPVNPGKRYRKEHAKLETNQLFSESTTGPPHLAIHEPKINFYFLHLIFFFKKYRKTQNSLQEACKEFQQCHVQHPGSIFRAIRSREKDVLLVYLLPPKHESPTTNQPRKLVFKPRASNYKLGQK